MISAFGVIHKSFLPTGAAKPAHALTEVERKLIRAKASGKTIKLKTKSGGEKLVRSTPNRAKNAPSAAGRTIYPGTRMPGGKLTKVIASRSQTGQGLHVQGFSQPDGRGGGRIVIHNDADFKATSKHEMAHITPRRNPHTFFRRAQNPERLGREEGRADFLAHGRQTTGQYPGPDNFQRGYNEVQGKMASAKWRKDRR